MFFKFSFNIASSYLYGFFVQNYASSKRFRSDMYACFKTLRTFIAFPVHINHIGIQINHSKIQLNELFSLLIQFNKIAIQCNISEASLIKYKFTLPTIEK